jgi:DNA polymerase III epsilon subunit-like protein
MSGAIRCFLIVLGTIVASGTAAQERSWPDAAPDDWLLAFVDVETTGLVPGYHEMIDIGIVMTDIDGRELGDLFLRIQPQFPERTDPGARAVNAFDEQRWKDLGALDGPAAIARMRQFHTEIAAGRSVLLVAFNSHFDTAFLDHLFRGAGASWRELYHYFVLDLPSMAWSRGLRGLTGSSLSAALGVTDEPHVAELHTGITGARLNARIYRALRDLPDAAQ